MKSSNKKILKTITLVFILGQILLLTYGIYTILSSILLTLFLRILIIGGFILLNIVLTALMLIGINRRKKTLLLFSYIMVIIITAISLFAISVLFSINSTIDNITGKKYMDVNSSFVTLIKDNYEELSDLKGKKVGLLENTKNYESNVLPIQVLKDNKITVDFKYAPSYAELILGLLDGEYDAVALPSNFKTTVELSDDLMDDFDLLENFYSTTKKVEIVTENSENIKAGDPFTIVLIGTDSPLETHHHNYDVLVLLTFNPETKDLAITSVYRATGMYSKCIGGFDLVTHNGWKGWGPSCLKSTIEDFFDIDISYYAMIDFHGFVDMIDAIGGIEVNVQKDIREQNSDRDWGSKTIRIQKGLQTLNGEEALAYARHRKSYEGEGGIIRSENHVTVIKAIFKKLISKENLFKFDKLMKILQDNMETDMNKDQLQSLYKNGLNVLEDVKYDLDKVNIIPLSMQGYGAMLYSPAMHTSVGISMIYEKSYNTIYNTLHTIIDYKPKKPTYFSFDLSEDPKFIPEVYLPGIREQAVDPRVMENLVGKTAAQARAYAKKYLYFVLTEEYVNSDTVPAGIVISQSIPAGEGFNHRFRMSVKVSLGPLVPIVEEEPIPIEEEPVPVIE